MQMTAVEVELIQMIRDSSDSVKAMQFSLDVLTRMFAGEDLDCIMESYGLGEIWQATKKNKEETA